MLALGNEAISLLHLVADGGIKRTAAFGCEIAIAVVDDRQFERHLLTVRTYLIGLGLVSLALVAWLAVAQWLLKSVFTRRQQWRSHRLAELDAGASERYFEERRALDFEERRALEASPSRLPRYFVARGLAFFLAFTAGAALLRLAGLQRWLDSLVSL